MSKKIIVISATILFVGVIIFALTGKNSSPTISKNNSVLQSKTPANSYTTAQVVQHSSETSCWMIISGNVYDVTSYIPEHPNTQILDGCGKDATTMFDNVSKHMGRATDMLSNYLIGTLSN